ncbi:damage-control phosphatase ARMT1 family protein [Abyssisolibacter fermentans]|uniref:damage-control phosphatase ARMT1 family protein n=1 Tax=Abyssisolibacter fermentans TaxID=1766203 RepID=UPI00082C448A|nr:ARMT1-like domain-containing protein [Abyssisolibacter fermentans]
MKLNFKCLPCNLNQTLRITELLNCTDEQKKLIFADVFDYLKNIDYELANPHTMKGILKIVTKYTNNANPYSEIKKYYNNILLDQAEAIENIIMNSNDLFFTALKTAIIGNIIDFGPAHKFNKDIILEKIKNVDDYNLTVNNSNELKDALSKSKTLLYIGDNCGEIVLDKIFIKFIKETYPDLKVIFAVRGKPALNDVTTEDALMVKMDEVAEIIDSGDGSPGTILENTSDSFREVFFSADTVIAKGQGNYEGLSDVNKDNLFLLFMAKCEVVANIAGVEKMSIVCLKN